MRLTPAQALERWPHEGSAEAMKEQKKLEARAKRYGLTPAQLEALLALKPGCWICGKLPPPPLMRRYIDHDHKTKRVRGVLCHRCNYRLLGRGLEDPGLHHSAAYYLRSAFDARKNL